MATWAEFELADPELAAFGRARLHHQVCFHATLRADGSPRVHPIEAWIAAGLLLVRFRGHSPKVAEVLRDGRYALHSPMDNLEGEGGEFLVRGWMERISDRHPGAQAITEEAPFPRAFFAMSVDEAVATTYEGDAPVYRRWRPAG
ncbi:MAG: pyridoxamine 5'-phosphate oxidase family protein [Actinomycetota bacterium]